MIQFPKSVYLSLLYMSLFFFCALMEDRWRMADLVFTNAIFIFLTKVSDLELTDNLLVLLSLV